MPGQPKLREKNPGKRPKRNQRTMKKEQIRSSAYGQLMVIAAAQGVKVGANTSTAEILQECLNRASAHFRFAASKVDELDPEPAPILSGNSMQLIKLAKQYGVRVEEGDSDTTIRRKIQATLPEPMWERRYDAEGAYIGEEPSKWYRLEAAARAEVTNLAGMMEKLGLAERLVRVEEARAALVVRAVAEAAREVGVPRDQVRAMGELIRSKLEANERVEA